MPRTKESGPERYEPHTWSVNVPPDDYIGQLEAERDALLEALNAGNLSGETAEIRGWCGVVLSNLERPE